MKKINKQTAEKLLILIVENVKVSKISKKLGITRQTVYSYIKRWGKWITQFKDTASDEDKIKYFIDFSYPMKSEAHKWKKMINVDYIQDYIKIIEEKAAFLENGDDYNLRLNHYVLDKNKLSDNKYSSVKWLSDTEVNRLKESTKLFEDSFYELIKNTKEVVREIRLHFL